MTSLTSQGGKLVLRDGSLGTGQECCCDEETGACCSVTAGTRFVGTPEVESDNPNVEAALNAVRTALINCGWSCVDVVRLDDGYTIAAACLGVVQDGGNPGDPADDMCCEDFEVSFPDEPEPEFQGPFTFSVCIYKCVQGNSPKAWSNFGPEPANAGGFVGTLNAFGQSVLCNGSTKAECESLPCGGIFHPDKACPQDPLSHAEFCECADTWTPELGCDEENPAP